MVNAGRAGITYELQNTEAGIGNEALDRLVAIA